MCTGARTVVKGLVVIFPLLHLRGFNLPRDSDSVEFGKEVLPTPTLTLSSHQLQRSTTRSQPKSKFKFKNFWHTDDLEAGAAKTLPLYPHYVANNSFHNVHSDPRPTSVPSPSVRSATN